MCSCRCPVVVSLGGLQDGNIQWENLPKKSIFVAFPGFSIWIVGVPSLRDAGRILDDVRST